MFQRRQRSGQARGGTEGEYGQEGAEKAARTQKGKSAFTLSPATNAMSFSH